MLRNDPGVISGRRFIPLMTDLRHLPTQVCTIESERSDLRDKTDLRGETCNVDVAFGAP